VRANKPLDQKTKFATALVCFLCCVVCERFRRWICLYTIDVEKMTLVLEGIYRTATDFDHFDPVLVRFFLAAQVLARDRHDTNSGTCTVQPCFFKENK